ECHYLRNLLDRIRRWWWVHCAPHHFDHHGLHGLIHCGRWWWSRSLCHSQDHTACSVQSAHGGFGCSAFLASDCGHGDFGNVCRCAGVGERAHAVALRIHSWHGVRVARWIIVRTFFLCDTFASAFKDQPEGFPPVFFADSKLNFLARVERDLPAGSDFEEAGDFLERSLSGSIHADSWFGSVDV